MAPEPTPGRHQRPRRRRRRPAGRDPARRPPQARLPASPSLHHGHDVRATRPPAQAFSPATPAPRFPAFVTTGHTGARYPCHCRVHRNCRPSAASPGSTARPPVIAVRRPDPLPSTSRPRGGNGPQLQGERELPVYVPPTGWHNRSQRSRTGVLRLSAGRINDTVTVRIRKSCGSGRAGPRLPGQTRNGPQDFRIATRHLSGRLTAVCL